MIHDISRIALYMSVDFWTLDSPATTKYKKDTDMPISSSPSIIKAPGTYHILNKTYFA